MIAKVDTNYPIHNVGEEFARQADAVVALMKLRSGFSDEQREGKAPSEAQLVRMEQIYQETASRLVNNPEFRGTFSTEIGRQQFANAVTLSMSRQLQTDHQFNNAGEFRWNPRDDRVHGVVDLFQQKIKSSLKEVAVLQDKQNNNGRASESSMPETVKAPVHLVGTGGSHEIIR